MVTNGAAKTELGVMPTKPRNPGQYCMVGGDTSGVLGFVEATKVRKLQRVLPYSQARCEVSLPRPGRCNAAFEHALRPPFLPIGAGSDSSGMCHALNLQ